MRKRPSILLLVVALAALTLAPGASAETAPSPSIDGTLTFATVTADDGVVRGVFANFNLMSFTLGEIDDAEAGGVVVRLYDASNPARTISQVSLRPGAFSDDPPRVDPEGTRLTAPIDSVWGTFDYEADGYWVQPRNLRINGGNCDRIGGAEVTVQLTGDRPAVRATIAGPPQGSCDSIRR